MKSAPVGKRRVLQKWGGVREGRVEEKRAR